jgi:P27 family predicted phage terminase small subunit
MSKPAQAVWRRLRRLGLFTEADRDAVARYCALSVFLARLEQEVMTEDPIVRDSKGGAPKRSPAALLYLSTLKEFHALAKTLGLAPAARGYARPEEDRLATLEALLNGDHEEDDEEEDFAADGPRQQVRKGDRRGEDSRPSGGKASR